MANPVSIDCPKGVYTKIATNVTTGITHVSDGFTQKILVTNRLTGEAAPANDITSWPLLIPKDIIDSSAAIDVYVKPMEKAFKIIVES
jgi:hypothetical protein